MVAPSHVAFSRSWEAGTSSSSGVWATRKESCRGVSWLISSRSTSRLSCSCCSAPAFSMSCGALRRHKYEWSTGSPSSSLCSHSSSAVCRTTPGSLP
eukprot:scaffold28867_cov63-Phaeocystis_antarctica.AAC.1